MNKRSLYLESNLKVAEAVLVALTIIVLAANLVAAPYFLGWWVIGLYLVEMIPVIVAEAKIEASISFKIGATLLAVISVPVWAVILITNFVFREPVKNK